MQQKTQKFKNQNHSMELYFQKGSLIQSQITTQRPRDLFSNQNLIDYILRNFYQWTANLISCQRILAASKTFT